MEKRTRIVVALAFACALTAGTSMADDLNCDGLLLPDRSADDQRCGYVHVPPASFVFTEGKLRLTWPEGWEVTEAWIAEDWEPVTRYVAGDSVRMTIDRTKTRYDVVAWARLRETGETFRILTPVWCVRSDSAENCVDAVSVHPGSCSITQTADCGDGSKASVTCSGDSGCSGSATDGESGSATCTATSTTTTTIGSRTSQKVETNTLTEKCVKRPETQPQTPK